MLLLFPRKPRPDFDYWRGRRLLAAVDALAWPLAVVIVISASSLNTGVFGAVATAAAGLVAMQRLRCALWMNQRYRFTTWVWGSRLAVVLAFGCLLKVVS